MSRLAISEIELGAARAPAAVAQGLEAREVPHEPVARRTLALDAGALALHFATRARTHRCRQRATQTSTASWKRLS